MTTGPLKNPHIRRLFTVEHARRFIKVHDELSYLEAIQNEENIDSVRERYYTLSESLKDLEVDLYLLLTENCKSDNIRIANRLKLFLELTNE